MMPGPDQIIACPKCKGLAKHMTLLSGNTFGACLWSDGKLVAPMKPRPPAVVKCRHCGECYWLADAQKVGTLDRRRGKDQQVNKDWTDVEEVQEPDEEDYYLALEKGLANSPKTERSLRILAWWRRNDAFRNCLKARDRFNPSVPGPWKNNLEALVNILDEGDDNSRLMKAEALRELGEFESAKQVLSRVDSPDVASVVSQLRMFCNARDRFARELRISD